MDQLHSILSKSNRVTVLEAEEADFFDYGKLFEQFYSDLAGKIKQNHIFHCGDRSTVGNQIEIHLRQSGLDEDQVVKHKMIKRGFLTREDYPNGAAGLRQAVAKRGEAILKLQQLLEPMKAPGINVYKKVELYTKYLCSGIVPSEAKDDVLYQQPTPEEMAAVKAEKKERKIFRDDINQKKAKLSAERKELKDKCMEAAA